MDSVSEKNTIQMEKRKDGRRRGRRSSYQGMD